MLFSLHYLEKYKYWALPFFTFQNKESLLKFRAYSNDFHNNLIKLGVYFSLGIGSFIVATRALFKKQTKKNPKNLDPKKLDEYL